MRALPRTPWPPPPAVPTPRPPRPQATLGNQALIPPPAVVPPFPDCPSTCVDLWVIDYIDVPKDRSCVCDTASLVAVGAVGWAEAALCVFAMEEQGERHSANLLAGLVLRVG